MTTQRQYYTNQFAQLTTRDLVASINAHEAELAATDDPYEAEELGFFIDIARDVLATRPHRF